MALIITNISSQGKWNVFFNQNGSPTFLQSWEWGELQKRLGYDILRLGILENKSLVAIALVIKIRAKRGNFLFVPQGPIIQIKSSKLKVQNYLRVITRYLAPIAKKERFSFIRISPLLDDSPECQKMFAKLEFRKAPLYMHAEHVWKLTLNKTEDELLVDMRKTTRYLIRKAIKDGATVEKRTDAKTVEDFMRIYKETAVREQFTPFSKGYILHEFEEFLKTGHALFLFGKLGGRTYRAAALIIFTDSTAFYHQGASIHNKVPVPYLLQWEAIREAKKRGCRFYNFWGIAPNDLNRHPWAGLTLFKKGFGGSQLDYLPTQDKPISLFYAIPWVIETITRWKRKA